MIKNKVIIVIISLFFINLASGLNLFSDTFESGNLNGWNLTSLSGASNWTASTTNPMNGSFHAQSQPQSTTEPASVIDRTISTAGYQNITFSYYRKLVALDGPDEFKARWDNGSGWTTIEETLSASANDASYLFRSFNLTVASSDNANFKIRFECTAGAISEFCRVDNVSISGNIILDTTPPSVTINSPQNIFYSTS
ncbi:MAG: hypothetical protein Q7R61_00495, partial [bacterium]|nr:hypothetical protein [bacterium]